MLDPTVQRNAQFRRHLPELISLCVFVYKCARGLSLLQNMTKLIDSMLGW